MDIARETAARILLKIELDDAYSSLSLNGALKQVSSENPKDSSFITALVYGVCERRLTLDYNISLYLKSKLSKLHPAVLTYLRLGTYQILFTDKVPDRAAINESVNLAKRNKLTYAAGLINAVLRKISSNGLVLPLKDKTEDYLSVLYSCPIELLRQFIDWYGVDRTIRILSDSMGKRPLFIRVNNLHTDSDKLMAELSAKGISVEKTDLECCLKLNGIGDITQLKQYINGDFFVQDKSSQVACKILGAKPGETLVDCCAAPGGKSFTSALNMNNVGSVYSCDIFPHKTDLMEKTAQRLGIGIIKTVCTDARSLRNTLQNADRVLCDVPCSGFGVLGRKPEIKYKSLDSLKNLPDIQYEILDSCSEMVKAGGCLVYSTCTLNPNENEKVCEKFLAEHKDFSIADEDYYVTVCNSEKYYTVFPSENGGDGFFVAKFFRSK